MTTPLEAALHYGLTQARPGSSAYLLAREVQQLRPIADAAAVYVTTTARRLDALDDPTLQALVDAVDGYSTGGVS